MYAAAITSSPLVELAFAVIGQTLPADHGYGLYSAIARVCPQVHNCEEIAIHTIPGIPDRKGKIYLTPHTVLRVRMPDRFISQVLPLAGKRLTIGAHSIQLGIPQIHLLQPSETLRSRLVTIKGYQEPEGFLVAARKQLSDLGIDGELSISQTVEGLSDRKAIKIKSFAVVGFGCIVSGLSDADSLKLQATGLGGKRRMGCGIFYAPRSI